VVTRSGISLELQAYGTSLNFLSRFGAEVDCPHITYSGRRFSAASVPSFAGKDRSSLDTLEPVGAYVSNTSGALSMGDKAVVFGCDEPFMSPSPRDRSPSHSFAR